MKRCLAVFLSVLMFTALNAQDLANPYASIGKPMPKMATLSGGAYDEFLTIDSTILIDGDVILRRTGELLFEVETDSAFLAELYRKQDESFRFLSVDPLQKDFPWWSPYHFAGNSPIENVDLDGLETYNYRLLVNSKTGKAQLEKIGEEHGSLCDCAFNVYVEYKGRNYFLGIAQFTSEATQLIDEVYNLHGKSEVDLDDYFASKHTPEELDAMQREENTLKTEEFVQVYFAAKYAQSRQQSKSTPSNSSTTNQRAANNGVGASGEQKNESTSREGEGKNVASYQNLKKNLALREMASIFKLDGTLKESTIAKSSTIMNGTQLNNQALILKLTADGSRLADWNKMSYVVKTGVDGKKQFDVHFYYNSKTKQTYYGDDYKVKEYQDNSNATK